MDTDRGQLSGIIQQRLAEHGVDEVLMRRYELVQIACSRHMGLNAQTGGGRGGEGEALCNAAVKHAQTIKTNQWHQMNV